MWGHTEDSSTKKKMISFYSTDGVTFHVTCAKAPDGVTFTIGMEDGARDVELSRAEALELVDFIKRGV
ncbi:hypothetical protein 7S12_23 [uncultured Caudovirales phage]|uniref:Uncharacterized protein n=2 Tax=root TaxID=1 RepID=A0A2H4J6L9_9CAUD|nr:hypothetical protein 3F3_7 [uncultured Caudovirales phage]ASN68034.1 hypothetical protein 3F4_7 [uncultured Caudovirales phage]ASN71009.1 hypothetical protein 7F10_23 [uncultured Caudovirales phage]ASN71111.1 hypothetical protein 3S10_24 [uncultured Caudovirales phage]ASN71280.1 hypothetical protein 7AX5_23 [uncultured Caudovirales phage]